MTTTASVLCPCTPCPGSRCTCGCQDLATPPSVQAASCACGPNCGCEGAEQGCLCSPPRS